MANSPKRVNQIQVTPTLRTSFLYFEVKSEWGPNLSLSHWNWGYYLDFNFTSSRIWNVPTSHLISVSVSWNGVTAFESVPWVESKVVTFDLKRINKFINVWFGIISFVISHKVFLWVLDCSVIIIKRIFFWILI
jgi:hypothetical protein